MEIKKTFIEGLYVIEANKLKDDRGYFSRTFCEKEFKKFNLCYKYPQCNISFNKKKGTLRGMHFQKAPHQEPKLVRCQQGAIYDVAIDLRPKSKTFKKWFGIDLSAENCTALYIPEDFAHGFITLTNNSTVFYQMGTFYNQESADGVRWDDPEFKIKWPITPSEISDKDKSYECFI